ncbi:hypothetical protein VTL71DRAFT_9440 [Oculimacula yallundae]|uniref:Uncharacterized protein n=1 Tax=Oculimacula yallundae TaxID=86028 RepID=A0ABR4BRX9_9HELO
MQFKWAHSWDSKVTMKLPIYKVIIDFGRIMHYLRGFFASATTLLITIGAALLYFVNKCLKLSLIGLGIWLN